MITETTTATAGSTMKRVAMASYVGSAIEYYDFYIYGTAAALVFPKVFFPHLGATMATVASMATFAAAFLSRPLGAAFFGHFGDRLGRKTTLTATLLIMGLSTVAVGVVPGTSTIGIAAPLILLTLRVVQGFAVGGEWAGSALLAAEYAPAAARGRYGMFTQMGVGSGLVMSSLVFLIVNATIGEASRAFLDWAWRLPFLFSAVLVVIALYVRLSVAETPVFAEQKAGTAGSGTPIVALFAAQRREVILAAGSHGGLLHVRLHGQRVPDQLRPYAPRVFAPADLVDRRRGRCGGRSLHGAVGRAMRRLRPPPHHHGCVRDRCAMGVRRDPVG